MGNIYLFLSYNINCMGQPTRADIRRAKKAIKWDEDTPDDYCNLWSSDNIPGSFQGNQRHVEEISLAMERYIKNRASMDEHRRFYDSRERIRDITVNKVKRI